MILMVSVRDDSEDDGVGFDYDAWAQHVDSVADEVNQDPHAWRDREMKRSMRESLPGFLRFLIR
jgi:hypothetical protein